MEPAQARRPGPEIQRKWKATEDDLSAGQQLVALLARADWSYTLAEVALYRPWRPGLAEFDVKPAPSIDHMQASVGRRYTPQSVVGDRHDHQDFSGQHKKRSREEMATRAEISGRLDSPQVKPWEVAHRLIQDAFFKVILPGLERETKRAEKAKA